MDTKSKKLSNSFAAKCVAFVLCIVLSTLSIVSVFYFANKARDASYEGSVWDILKQDASFVDSEMFAHIFATTADRVSTMFDLYSMSNDSKNNIDNPAYEAAFDNIFSSMSQIGLPLRTTDDYGNEITDGSQSNENRISVVFSVDSVSIIEYSQGEIPELDYSRIEPVEGEADYDLAPSSMTPLAEDSEYVTTETHMPLDKLEEISREVFFDISLIEGNEILITGESDGSGMTNGYLRHISEPGVREELERIYKKELDEVRVMLNDNFEQLFQEESSLVAMMASEYGINYFISDGELFLTNVDLTQDNRPRDKAMFIDSCASFSMVDGVMSHNVPSIPLRKLPINLTNPENVEMLFSFNDDFLTSQDSILLELHQEFYFRAILVIACMVLVIALVIWLSVVSGKAGEDGTRKLYALDRIPAEIQIAFSFLVIWVTVTSYSYTSGYYSQRVASELAWEYGFLIFGSLIIFTILLWVFLSIVRNIKAGLIIKRSLIYNVFKFLARFFKGFGTMIKTGFDKQNPIAKTILLVIGLFVVAVLGGCLFILFAFSAENFLSFIIFVLGVALLTLVLIYTYRFVEKYSRVKKGVDEIASGNTSYKIPVDEKSTAEFDVLAMRINGMGEAINVAVQNELKKELMKTELISNVSHDLKTPLTSIISYTDLLKTEGLDSKNAMDYLNIIDDKGQRLKQLTEDLFAAAKAASGDMPINKGKVDLLALINQEIVELNGQITDKDFDIQIVTKEDNYFIYADNQLIWRVVDNLLTNVSKYALPGSRVYIEINDDENTANSERTIGMTTLQIKNISETQLNIPVEELMERFKRGDESRTTSGSGLGLAIANDLVRIMDGELNISIDGDLFKAVVTMPTYEESSSEEC